MNKSTKIWLNYSLGAVISALLLWSLFYQVRSQLEKFEGGVIVTTGHLSLLFFALALMPVNIFLESLKWHLLASSAQPLTYKKSLASYLAGIAFSIITPNRIGEYPARILYLKRTNTFRLISVSILGAIAQMLTLFLYGLLGLIYFNIKFPTLLHQVVLALCFVAAVIIFILYWRFETWAPFVEKIKWLRRYKVYGKLLKRFTTREQLTILGISITRYGIYTAQYLILLQWLNVGLPIVEGFLMSALFFWSIAVVPTIALAELGQRGQISLYLFHHLSDNTIGILSATVGIWCINLIIPAIIGSILILRARFVR